MKITVEFGSNWRKDDVDALLENNDLSAQDLKMDYETYLEVLAIAALMKQKNLTFADAVERAHADISSSLEECFSNMLLESYLYFYRQALIDAI